MILKILLPLFLAAFVHANPTVCGVTINSDDEFKAFQDNLPKDRVNFKELVNQKIKTVGGAESWFDNACADSSTQCDTLVISGHWQGYFMSPDADKPKQLSMSKLDHYACANLLPGDAPSCKGVLSKPKEVLLFGCNTLAAREPSSDPNSLLSPEQYRQKMINNGLSASNAESLTNTRYGPLGSSTRSAMLRAFAGVPHIAGFTKAAPTGGDIGNTVGAYVRSIGDYPTHLSTISGETDSLLMVSKSQSTLPLLGSLFSQGGLNCKSAAPFNRTLGSPSLGRSQMAQLSGVVDSQEIEALKTNCRIRSDYQSDEARVRRIGDALGGPNWLSYMPAVEETLRYHSPDSQTRNRKMDAAGLKAWEAMVEKLKDSPGKRDILAVLKATSIDPLMNLELADTAYRLKWISREQVKQFETAAVTKLLNSDIHEEARDVISRACDSRAAEGNRLDLSTANISYRSSFARMSATNCTR